MFLKNGRKTRLREAQTSLRPGDKITRVKREFSSGGAVYKKDKEIRWLIIKPQQSKTWRLPKGNIEKGETSQDTAIREVQEETGVKAVVLEKLGKTTYFYFERKQKTSPASTLHGARILKTVVFFLMEYKEGKAEIGQRWAHEIDKVKWVTTEEAIKKLSFKDEKDILKKATSIIRRGARVVE